MTLLIGVNETVIAYPQSASDNLLILVYELECFFTAIIVFILDLVCKV